MPAESSLRIFLASPGDLEDERSAVAKCVDTYNQLADPGGPTFEVMDWSLTRGTARRAQGAINELIATSHFMIVLFKESWGSTPGSPWGYSSGTEEELFTGLLELGQAGQPMRDIWVGFCSTPSPDPRVGALKKSLIDEHAVMFESLAGTTDLLSKLADRLQSWARTSDVKTPRHVQLTPSSGMDVLGAANARIRGEKLIELGQSAVGMASLARAAELGGPLEHLSYARALRRAGDFEASLTQTQLGIDYFGTGQGQLYSTLAAEVFAERARVLKAQRKDRDAIVQLEHALTLLTSNDEPAISARCRILDDLGLAYQRLKDFGAARAQFDSALVDRRTGGRPLEVAQSLVNLARLEVASGQLDVAVKLGEEATSLLLGTPPTPLHANSRTLMAQLRLRQGRALDGLDHAEWALTINRQIGNPTGEAIALKLMAQCHREAGHIDQAIRYAQQSHELNERMGNKYGMNEAHWILDQLGSAPRVKVKD